MNYIESKDNKKIKLLNKLNQKKYREEMGLSVVEGLRSIKQIIDLKVEIIEIFVMDSKKSEYEKFLDEINSNIVKDSIFDSISDTVNSQGIIAIVKNKKWNLDDTLKNSNKIILLDKVQDPGNVGTIFRTAVATDYDAIFYTKGTTDIFSHKVNRSSMGVNFALPCLEVDEKVLKDTDFKIYVTMLDSDSKQYDKVNYDEKFILVLGNEANGVCEEVKQIADEKIYIPISNNIESLNVSIAGAVIMFKSIENKN